jgi:hypothetical protein
MAGFFEDIGEFFTGDKKRAAETRTAEQQAQQQAQAEAERKRASESRGGVQAATKGLSSVNKDIKALEGQNAAQAQAATGRADQYGQQVASDMGSGAADYMQRANAAATGQADELANKASKSAMRQQLMAARSAGLNKGASALAGGRGASDQYNQQFAQQLQRGQEMYGQNVAQRAGLGQTERQNQQQFTGMQMQGQNQRAQNTQAAGNLQAGLYSADTGAAQTAQANAMGLNQQQGQDANAAGAAGGATTGGLFQALGSIVGSDERIKDNIAPSGASRLDELINKAGSPSARDSRLEELANKVRSVDFNYKPGSGEDPSKNNVGVIAQDLEQTDMRDNVIDTPAGKAVDVGKQTMSNTNYIADMARELYELKAELSALRGQK